MVDVWAMVHEERAALHDDLSGVAARHWDESSLCDGWTIHDMLAHLVDTARTTQLSFVLDIARAGFDFDRQNARGVQRARGATPQETLLQFSRVISRKSTPPAPLDTRLVEAVVHGEDIRRPLGLVHPYSQDAVVRSLRLQARTRKAFGGAKELVADVQLRTTDGDVVIGDGPHVTGSALSLLLAISGRRVALDDLDGPGAAVLKGAFENLPRFRSD